jgi:propanol-preferring alcohol dehydrogenase
MEKTMKAALVEKFGKPLTIKELPIPTRGPGQVLVQVISTGVCHTDLHAMDGDWPVKPTLPFIPGHEGAGVVVSLGQRVKHLKEGDRVGIAWLHSACGYCHFCLSGWETLCHAQQNSGYSANGTFAEYALGQADYVGRIPDKLSFTDAAPILCAGVTTYKGLKQTEARPGEWVVISGVGGRSYCNPIRQGHGVTRCGGRPWVGEASVGPNLGVEVTVDAATEDPPRMIQERIRGAHGVLVTVVSPIAFREAVGILRRGGTCVLHGLPPGEFPISIFDVVLNGYTLRGSIVGIAGRSRRGVDIRSRRKSKINNRNPAIWMRSTNVFTRLKQGKVTGRVVLELGQKALKVEVERKK